MSERERQINFLDEESLIHLLYWSLLMKAKHEKSTFHYCLSGIELRTVTKAKGTGELYKIISANLISNSAIIKKRLRQ